MSEATHTPGKWTVEDVSGVARHIYVTATDHRRGSPFIVALVYQKTPADQSQPEDVATNMANARLIAAAPDLLAMVERLVHHCNGGAWAGREQREQIVKDLEAADAVIAKAKWA